MSGKNINFNDKKIIKSHFCKNKEINNIEDIDVNNILISKKKKKHTVIKIHIYNLLYKMIMISLHH